MMSKYTKSPDGDSVYKTKMNDGAGLYRVKEEDEGIITEDGPHAKEYMQNFHHDNDAEMDDPDVMFEYKAYHDQSFVERSQKAKRIRQMQLEAYKRREESGENDAKPEKSEKRTTTSSGSIRHRKTKRSKTVMFEWNVLFMDAVLRNETMEVDRLLSTYEVMENCPKTELANCRSPDGLTPLHQCCIENLTDMASLLIKNGAELRAVDSELWTPLHAAATCGHLSMVRILIEAAKTQRTASSNSSTDTVRDMLLAVNSDGNMPFDLCDNDETLAYIEEEMQRRGITQDDIEAKRHKTEVDMLRDLKSFIDSHISHQLSSASTGSLRERHRGGAKTIQREVWDKFIAASKLPHALMMHIAAANGYLEVMDLLLKHKYPISLEDEDGWLPIHAAVAWNQQLAAKKLVEAGADIMSTIRGSNETALDLAAVAEQAEEHQPGDSKFTDDLIIWDNAYKARMEEEQARRDRSQLIRRPSNESVTSVPGSMSPLLRRSSPKSSLRVQRRSSLKEKEDLIALLHTLGDHDLKSPENDQMTIQKFTRSPGGSLRDRNPTLPNVPEEVTAASAVVHIAGSSIDADLINETISPELISSLLRTFDEHPDIDETESVAEQLMKSAEDSLNQIDQPVTLAQLKSRRNRFRLLKREKPLSTRELPKDSKEPTKPVNGSLNGQSSTSKLPSPVIPKETRQNGLGSPSISSHEPLELQKFTATRDELPVGSNADGMSKLNDRFGANAKKKDKSFYKVIRPGKDKDSVISDDTTRTKTWPRLPPSNGCCVIA